jgi:hypothetical protein
MNKKLKVLIFFGALISVFAWTVKVLNKRRKAKEEQAFLDYEERATERKEMLELRQQLWNLQIELDEKDMVLRRLSMQRDVADDTAANPLHSLNSISKLYDAYFDRDQNKE